MTEDPARYGRRRLLRAVASTLAVGLAGCSAVQPPADTPTPSPTRTDAPPTATETPASEEWRPPEYVDREDIQTSAVTVPSPAGCSLPGEVTVPAGAADDDTPAPSVVLLGGSGPTDLDGSIGPNRPYRDLAYGLGTAGNASLRFTKRTAVCGANPATFTVDDEYTEDAIAAVERLRSRPGADAERTVVMGHSQGALLAPRVASRLDGVAGLVLLAPPGRPLHELLLAQIRYLAERDGTVSQVEQQRLDRVSAAVDRIDRLDIAEGETVLGGGRPYWKSLREYDAFETARSLSVPIIVLHGGRDFQVTATDLERWEAALAGQPNVAVERYPDLNHLFMPGEGPSTPAEYRELGHVDHQVVADLDAWLEARWTG